MKPNDALVRHATVLLLFTILNFQTSTVFAQGTAFTYQGRLNDGGNPANGTYDLHFTIYDAAGGGNPVGMPVDAGDVGVSNGLFTVTLDFGAGVFTGAERWLLLSVKTNGTVNFTPLMPLQKFTATPYAMTANNLNGSLSGDSLSGTYANAVSLNNEANNFSGNGSGLTSLNASNLIGAVADGRLSSNVALRGGGNDFTGNQTIAGSVGLGTTTPATLLEIQGATPAGPTLRLTGVGGDGAKVGIDLATYNPVLGGAVYPAARIEAIDNNWSAGIDFQTKVPAQQHSALVSRLFIQNAGNVGIGTTTPVSTLQVNGSVTAPSFSGNAGTTLTLGTTDNQATEIRANSLRGWRVEPDPRANGIAANLIGGATNNTIEGQDSGGSVIVGGGWLVQPNVVHSNSCGVFIGAGSGNHIGPNVNDAVIGGGNANSNAGFHAVIAGGERNAVRADADHAIIGGGGFNTIIGSPTLPGYGVIAGGRFNAIRTNSSYATVGGGINNSSAGEAATVPGGGQNSALGNYSFAAGHFAYASHPGTFVWADSENSLFPSTVPDQFSVRASGGVRFETGGAGMRLDGVRISAPQRAPDGASHSNIVNVVNGSSVNFIANGVYGATIAGGGAENYLNFGELANSVRGDFSTVGGGGGNEANAAWATVAGGYHNMIQTSASFTTIGGGSANTIQSNAFWAIIGGGSGNTIQTNAISATISGGSGNTIQTNAYRATIGGGSGNTIQTNASSATISGGLQNTIQSDAYNATISGGFGNTVQTNAIYAAISGGLGNKAGGNYGFVAGGFQNSARGDGSFAAGQNAQALHPGTFVWSDSSGGMSSTGPNQFCIRASGGVRLSPATDLNWGSGSRLWPDQGGAIELGDSLGGGNTPYIDFHYGVTAVRDFNIRLVNDGDGQLTVFRPGVGTPMLRLTGSSLTVNGTFVSSSDRNVKENFAPVRLREMLAKVVALPLSSWNYKADAATRHVGPMAQDFYAAFNVGPDDKHIATVDADGVALAAIQGLNQKVEEKNARIADLERRLEKLERLFARVNGGAQ